MNEALRREIKAEVKAEVKAELLAEMKAEFRGQIYNDTTEQRFERLCWVWANQGLPQSEKDAELARWNRDKELGLI